MKTYTKEFKIAACELVLKQGEKPVEISRKLGINTTMLHRWVAEYRADGADAFTGKGNLSPRDKELQKLRKENERLKKECEILKKAAAYFAKAPDGE